MKTGFFTFLLFCSMFSLSAQDPIVVPQTQGALVTKLTATWCPICGGSAWDSYKKMVKDLSSKSVVMAAHISTVSRLYSPTAVTLLNNFDPVFSQPFFFFNTKVIGASGTTMENTIFTNVNNASQAVPVAQTGLRVSFQAETRELTVQGRSQFFKGDKGEYFLAFYLIEKAVVEEQSTRSSKETHSNVLRTSLLPEVFGQPLASGDIVEGTIKGTLFSYTLPEKYTVDNLVIASVIWKKNGTKYDLINANWTDQIGQTVTNTQDLLLLQGFQIWPNLVQDVAQVRVKLPAASQQVILDVFDMKGRKIQTLFQGKLPAGAHAFSLNRADFPAAGKYTVRLRSGAAQASQAVMVF